MYLHDPTGGGHRGVRGGHRGVRDEPRDVRDVQHHVRGVHRGGRGRGHGGSGGGSCAHGERRDVHVHDRHEIGGTPLLNAHAHSQPTDKGRPPDRIQRYTACTARRTNIHLC